MLVKLHILQNYPHPLNQNIFKYSHWLRISFLEILEVLVAYHMKRQCDLMHPEITLTSLELLRYFKNQE